MSRLIDADALLYDIEIVPLTDDGGVDINDLDDIIKRQPTIEERKTGKWAESHMNKNMRICRSCGFMVNKSLLYDYTEKDPLVFKYCPNCGAKMEG